jgi:excisionase family DNA binding protein
MGMERIESPLLSTGDAASFLGVSRQHVVDLCDRGDLIFVWVGSHVVFRGWSWTDCSELCVGAN